MKLVETPLNGRGKLSFTIERPRAKINRLDTNTQFRKTIFAP
jgi:hypothetical protein